MALSIVLLPPRPTGKWGLRDYGHDGQLGLEKTPEEYVEKMVAVFREVRRVLRKDGTLWLNLGDSYMGGGQDSGKSIGDMSQQIAGNRKVGDAHPTNNAPTRLKHESIKPKDLIGIPWRVAFALQKDGWWLRQDIIWHKPNPMPESVTDRCTKSHEYIFLLSKSATYYCDMGAIKEKATYAPESGDYRPPGIVRDRLLGYDSKEAALRGRVVTQTENGVTIRHPEGKHGDKQQSPKSLVEYRNKRSVWTVATKPYSGAHFAVYPEELITPCILAGCPRCGVVLDPFAGSGTTGYVAKKHGRDFILIELNPEYKKLIDERLQQEVLL